MSKKRTQIPHDDIQRQLALVMALDDIRDNAPDPTAMFSQIVNRLADEFKTELCLLAVIHRDTGELEMKSLNQRGDLLKQIGLERLQKLAESGVRWKEITTLTGKEALAQAGIAGAPLVGKLYVAVVPIVMGTAARLGVLVMARRGAAFTEADRGLLESAESQLDSAVIQGHTYYQLSLRNKELETIYRVDRIRDQHLAFDEMLNKALYELKEVIQAEMGFIMLYHQPTDKLEMRAYTHEDLFHSSTFYEIIEKVARESLAKARLVYHNESHGEMHSIMCIPLILKEEILGVFGVANRFGSQGFDEEDRRLIGAIASQIDTAIFEGLEKRKLKQVLGRSIDPSVMERLLANPDASTLLRGERATISVLYADIRGSTALAEHTSPELLVGFINDYLAKMAEVILTNEGTLDKFVGDEVMAFFGAPHPHPDHALRAARVGLKMQEAHQKVMDAWEGKGVIRSPIGVGIATGELIVGEMGSAQRTNYTVIGNAANLGARICGAAKPGQVLASQATYDLIRDRVEAEPMERLQFKGVSGDVTVYAINRIVGE